MAGLTRHPMKIFLFVFVFTISFRLFGQEPVIKRERLYEGKGLYGFMNGAADLYYEYGFKSLLNREIKYKGEDFTVDVYEMPSREDAFGIYSMNVHRCQQADSMGFINCFAQYQLLSVIDNYYVSIVFPSGSAKAQQIATELISLYVSANKSTMPGIPEEFSTLPPFSGVIKYLKGPISVSSESKDLSILLKNAAYKGVWFKPDNQTKSYKAVILFSSPDEMRKFRLTIQDSDIIKAGDDSLFIQRKEVERGVTESGEFGF